MYLESIMYQGTTNPKQPLRSYKYKILSRSNNTLKYVFPFKKIKQYRHYNFPEITIVQMQL